MIVYARFIMFMDGIYLHDEMDRTKRLIVRIWIDDDRS